MAGIASSRKLLNYSDKPTILWVKRPASNSSKEIRDSILIEIYGYTEADIIDFDLKKPGYFYISNKNSKEWATYDEVRKWIPNANGEIPITMPQYVIDDIVAFRKQRVEFQIYRIGTFITNPEIREAFAKDLMSILNLSGQIRIDAFNGLMGTITTADRQTKVQIHYSLRFLTDESGYKKNPFLLLAFAKTTIYSSDEPSFSSPSFNQTQIGIAVRAANESLFESKSKSELTKISKMEAALINNWASQLYKGANAHTESLNRSWIERFLTMSPQERDSYDDGDLIPMIPPNQTAVRDFTRTELRRFDHIEKMQEQLEEWQATDNIGAPQPVKTDHRTSELFQRVDDTYEKQELGKKKIRGTDKGYKPKLEMKLKPSGFNQYTKMNVLVDGVSAPFALFIEAAKWRVFHQRMAVVTDYINKKEALERQIRNERVRLKPPLPEATLLHIKEFQRYRRITTNSSEKQRIIVTIEQLYVLLEEGRAYYK